jgi:dethiobiotin synthetase
VKPVQTGLGPDEPGDLTDIDRLAGPVESHEPARLPDPLAPDTAARVAGRAIPSVAEHAAYVEGLARRGDLDVVLVEGAGGLLVRLDTSGGTLADLGSGLLTAGLEVTYVVVSAAGLGTLNHSALTAEALRARRLPCSGFVVGSWPQPPDEPDLAMRCNLEDLPAATGFPLLGVLPAGAGVLSRGQFLTAAPGWLTGW